MPKRGVIAQAMPQGDIIGLAPPLCGTTDAATNAAEPVAEVLG